MHDQINCWLHQLALQVAIDSATPVDDGAGPSGNLARDNLEPYGGYGGPVRTYGRMYGSLDFDDVSTRRMHNMVVIQMMGAFELGLLQQFGYDMAPIISLKWVMFQISKFRYQPHSQ